jgi:hypothetical protein
MLHISPVKLIAALAAVTLAVGGLFFASEARQGVVNMFAVIRLSSPAKSPQPSRQAEVSATPSGVRVIPIGVAPKESPASAGKSGGG